MITISDNARDYLLKKGGAVHLSDSYRVGMCCGHVNFCPTVSRGIPKNEKKYKFMIINKITIFVPISFESPYPLTIEVRNFLGLNTLHIKGWKLM